MQSFPGCAWLQRILQCRCGQTPWPGPGRYCRSRLLRSSYILLGFTTPYGAPNNRMERLAGRSASELRKAAVDGDLAGGHEAAVRRREKGGHGPDLRRIGHALEWSHRGVDLLALLAERFLREFGRRRPGRQHVYPDAGALQVLRPGPREVAHCRLARAVGSESRGARGAGARSGQDDRTALVHQRQRLLDREDRTLHIGVEGFVNVLGGDLAERKLASHPGIGEDDVEGSALGLHRRVESVEVGLIGDRALHRAGIGPEVGHSGVERSLPAAEDEDEGALLDEALCCGAADAGSPTRDDCNLTFKLSHNYPF